MVVGLVVVRLGWPRKRPNHIGRDVLVPRLAHVPLGAAAVRQLRGLDLVGLVGELVDSHRHPDAAVALEGGVRGVGLVVGHDSTNANFSLVVVDLADDLAVLALELLADQRVLTHLIVLIRLVGELGRVRLRQRRRQGGGNK